MFNDWNYLDLLPCRLGFVPLGRPKHSVVIQKPPRKPEPFVNLHRARIFRPYVKERNFSTPADALRENRHQKTSVAVSEVLGMGADRADFRVPGQLHPFP